MRRFLSPRVVGLGAFALSLAFVAKSAPPLRAQTPADLVVLPFALPGDTAPYEDAATSELVARLQAAGGDVKLVKPADPFAVAHDATALCTNSGAHAIVTGRLRVEQTSTSGSLGFIPYIGPLAKALVNTHPSHAVVTLDRIDCHGNVLARASGVADVVHHGSNVGAGVTVSVKSAVDDASSKLVGMPDASGEGDVWLVTGARLTPAGILRTVPQARGDSRAGGADAAGAGASAPSTAPTPVLATPAPPDAKRIALASVEDTRDPDAREQFADSTMLRRLNDAGYTVAEVAPLDRLEVARRAAEICATAGAGRILASAIRYEQSAIDTFISTSYPTHAFLHFDLLDCGGTVVHSEDITSDVSYQFSNVGAAISKALDNGIAEGLVKLGLIGEATKPH